MKIAVISAIHGNMEALNAVLENIKSEDCEKIFALGDYAMAGPEPDKTVEFFMNNKDNYVMIQGNTDYMISNFNEELFNFVREHAPVMAEALKNDIELLTDEQKEFLKNLPAQKEIEADGIKFLLVHGSPRRNNEDILPDTPLYKVEEMLDGVNSDIVLCGHTHIPCGFQTNNKKTVVNAGSVGRPFTENPEACYLKINVENGTALFEHKFVKYDNKTSSEKVKARGFKGSEKLSATLLNPIERHF